MDDDLITALHEIRDRLDVLARRLDGQREMGETAKARADRRYDAIWRELDHLNAQVKAILDILVPQDTKADHALARVRVVEDRVTELEREVNGHE